MANTLIGPAQSGTNTGANTATTKTADPGAATKDMFLKLMVAQLKNQDPLNPTDGTAYLQQLSQISGVEQMIEMRQQLEAIHNILSANSSQTAATSAGGQ
jgi:flagellar basal-body rod modification protein FlgD